MAILKQTAFDAEHADGTPTVERVKTASMVRYHSDYMPAIGEFLKDLRPEPNHIYVLSNALGGSEVWGANRNADLFPAKPHWGLANPTKEWGYPTFVEYAHVFRQHRNQLVQGHPSYGRIMVSSWNPKMYRVETIAKIRRGQPDIEDVIAALDRHEPVAVSMGCRIPFDECTICGNRARTVQYHCEHLKSDKNAIRPDGVQVAMINYYPVFFDQSFVRRGADPSAWAHRTVAQGPIDGHAKTATAAEDRLLQEQAGASQLCAPRTATPDDDRVIVALSKTAAEHPKKAAIYKRVPGGQAEAVAGDRAPARHGIAPRLRGQEPMLPRPFMAKQAALHPLGVIASTLHFAGVSLRPEEFQYMALCRRGRLQDADRYADAGVVGSLPKHVPQHTESVGPRRVSRDLFDALVRGRVLEHRSYWRPYYLARAARYCRDPLLWPPVRDKTEAVRDAALDQIIGLYGDLHRRLAQLGARGMDDVLEDPAMAKMAMDSVLALRAHWQPVAPSFSALTCAPPPDGAEAMKEAGGIKKFVGLSAVGVPAAYVGSGRMRVREAQGQPLNYGQRKVKESPLWAGVGGAAVGAYGWNKIHKRRQRRLEGSVRKRGLGSRAAGAVVGAIKKVAAAGFIAPGDEPAAVLEELAFNPATYDIPPEETDAIAIESMMEAEQQARS